jgi:hypothetical protein
MIVPVKTPLISRALLSILAMLALCAWNTPAAALGHLTVRIRTGSEPLLAGSDVELRIYEAGGKVRRLPLAHGESWLRDSTRVIPVTLNDPLDPRSVSRFGIYYRAAQPESPPWEIVDADVEISRNGETPQRLLDTSLSGVIARQGELSTPERSAGSMLCSTDADCDDHRTCNGVERCAPRTAGADARGCVRGTPVVCPVNQVCSESRGCLGPAAIRKIPVAPAPAPATPR